MNLIAGSPITLRIRPGEDSRTASPPTVPLTTPQRDEFDRRLADHAAHPNDVLSWAELNVSLDERLR